MNSRRPAQSNPLLPFSPSTSPSVLSLRVPFRESSLLFSLFPREKYQNLPFVFNNLPTLLHSCKNKSFIYTLFTKTPRGYPFTLPTPQALLEVQHSFFALHQSPFTNSQFGSCPRRPPPKP